MDWKNNKGFKRHKICIFLAIILLLLDCTNGSCDMIEQPKSDNLCVAALQCEQVIEFVPTSWNCIKHEKNVYVDDNRYYYERRQRFSHKDITYDTNYKLYINMKNVDDQHDIFESVSDIMKNIITFQMNSGTMLDLPQKIYQLSQATDIEVSNNQLSTVSLNSFISLTELKTIKLRNNSISALNIDNQAKYLVSRSVKAIDLSQNVLETIPNTCFSLFTELQNLNLSYNKISSFDILTFEGVMKLKVLDVSHNRLFEIGNSFTRFMNLNELYLQNNKLTKLSDYNLSTLLQLKKLNLSSNIIGKFEKDTFKSLLMLEYLDFSDNNVEILPESLLEKNTNLHSLLIFKNRINNIENGAFSSKNITEFNIQGNNLTGSITKDTFDGVHATDLDLDNGRITSLDDEAFKYMCEDLNTLNISYNMISSISHSAFTCLERLTVLDLSNNRLENLNINTTSLASLTNLDVRNNKISKISKNVFNNLVSLKNIDLSHNDITEIESESFLGLENVNTLTVTHNPFVNTLENFTFVGLVSLQSIDLSFTRTTSYQNGSFSGLSAVKHINATFGQLSTIAFNAFIQTGSIEKLDLSHNLLEAFHINTSSISKIQEIYLNDNLLRKITNETFSGLKLLRLLNLINNNIHKIDTFALKNVEKLSHLYLSSNILMEIIGNPFVNLTNLYEVNLDNVKTKFAFQSATSIQNLDLHSCEISDLNKLFVFNVGDLRELNLSANKISKIDKFSFQSLPFLIKLDLSLNRISFIQPGAFLNVGKLREVTLFGNNLLTLQFGVFNGLTFLQYINLSSNALQSFEANLLPVVKAGMDIALDNNDIKHINFEEFFESEIMRLSVGGNLISCKVLAELKTSNHSIKYNAIVTTATLDFHSENVDGISCQSDPKNNGIVLPAANNSGYDIRPMFIQFTNAIENLRSSIEILGNNTTPEQSYQIKPDMANLINSIQALVDISNQTQIQSGDYFQKMENVTNTTQSHLEGIRDQLINLTDRTIDLRLNHVASDANDNNENNENIRSEMKQMLKEEIDAIREEFGKTFQNFQKGDPLPQVQVNEKESRDDKILYFIAAGLGMLIVLYVMNFVINFVKKDRFNSLHSSRRPIATEMELE